MLFAPPPDDILLLHRAGPAPGTDPAADRPSIFTGGGHTLGSDEVESTYIPDPTAVEQRGKLNPLPEVADLPLTRIQRPSE